MIYIWFNFPSEKKACKELGILKLNFDEPSSFKFVMRIFLSGSIVYYFPQERIHDSSLGKQFSSFYSKGFKNVHNRFSNTFLVIYAKIILKFRGILYTNMFIKQLLFLFLNILNYKTKAYSLNNAEVII